MSTNRPGRALLVSLGHNEAEMTQQLGLEAYSYRHVYRAFAPLLQKWGRVAEITRPESRLDHAIWRARRDQDKLIHLSFLPLHLTYLTEQAPNIAFPFWEFPDLPGPGAANPRQNWVRIANHLDLILTASTFTRDTFVRAGVTTPVRVVPVPIRPEYFAVPAWQPGQKKVLQCPAYVFPQSGPGTQPVEDPWQETGNHGLGLRERVRKVYRRFVRPCLPGRLRTYLTLTLRAAARANRVHAKQTRVAYPACTALELAGVVYTSIFNPFDQRKNWQDLLSAFLLALGDREDALLVIKLVVSPQLAALGLNDVLDYYQKLGLRHRCQLAFVTAYLSEEQMVELAQASTYYLNTARAEGACLPLQNYLAAQRPGIAPQHTAMADYFHNDLGFVVASHPEPAWNPLDPDQRCTTTWHRLVWQSLHDQLRASYETAKHTPAHYLTLATCGRRQMAEFASAEQVWPRLAAALDLLSSDAPARPRRKAS